MKYILSDRGDGGDRSDSRWGDSGWLPGHTGVGIPMGGSRQGRTETQAGVARIKDIVITVLSCRE